MTEHVDGQLHDFKSVGVIGAGTIGRSWLRIFGRNGIRTVVYDSDHDLARSVADELRAENLAVRACDDLTDFVSSVEYVQECVAEDLEVKRSTFSALDKVAPEHVVLGSSTSGFPASDFVADLPGAPRCLVVHPTNPPHLVPLVEIVPGPSTSPEITERVMTFMERIGQSPILCQKEIPGFVLNRLQYALEREAFYLVRQGVASVGDVDKTVREGLGPRWAFLGPFGVEATNAETIEDDLRKFGNLIRTLFAEVCQPFDGPNEQDAATVVDGVNNMFADATQQELLAYRSTMLTELRKLKQAVPNPHAK